MMKRILTLTLAITMLAGCCAFSALAEEEPISATAIVFCSPGFTPVGDNYGTQYILENSNLDLFSLEMFENIAYVMAKAADSSVPDTVEEWLDQFGMMSVWRAFPQIAKLWAASQKTNVDLKKKNVRQNAR